MKRVDWDGTSEDRERLKGENLELLLIAVENHSDGNFLVFAAPSDIEPPVVPPKSVEERLTALELQVAALVKKP